MSPRKSAATSPVATSPVVPLVVWKDPLLDFPAAVSAATKGSKVTRREWEDREAYIVRADGFLCIHNADDPKLHALLVSDADLDAADWEILAE
jgi:hypothetical protein